MTNEIKAFFLYKKTDTGNWPLSLFCIQLSTILWVAVTVEWLLRKVIVIDHRR